MSDYLGDFSISRRGFVRYSGMTVGAVTFASFAPSRAFAETPPPKPSEVYGRVGTAFLATNTPEQQRAALGLFLTAGVANRYRNGEIDETTARKQIQTIAQTGQIPDSIALKAVNDALTGANSLEHTPLDGVLDEGFKAFGIIAAPIFATPAGALTIAAVSAYGAPLVKYLQDPNNILTGQFAPPRPDGVLLAGATAMEQLDRLIRQKTDLAQIYKDVVPETTLHLKIGDTDPAEALANSVGGDLAEPLKRVLRATKADLQSALNDLEKGVYDRLDGLQANTKEVLNILREERDAKIRQQKLQAAQLQEQFIHQEIGGAITVVDAFTRYIIGDADAARKISGCLSAAQSAFKLFSAFAAGSLGPLGMAGGLASVLGNVFSMFSGPDPMTQRLDEIDKKLERMTQLLIDGFQHLDRRLTDVLKLSHLILQEVIQTKQVAVARLKELAAKTEYLTDVVISDARGDYESPLADAATLLRNNVLAKKSLTGSVIKDLSALQTHASTHSRRPEMNGKLNNPTAQGLSELLDKHIDDIRTALGNLQFAVDLAQAGIALMDQIPPDVKHWSRAAQGALELLMLVPKADPHVAASVLTELWRHGNFLKSAILAATNAELLLSLLDRYEVSSLRLRSNANIPKTLDELVAEMLAEPISVADPLVQHIENRVLLLPAQAFLDIGVSFRFLLSVLTWRLSDVGDRVSANPRAVDLITDRQSVAKYIIEALEREAAPTGSSGGGPLTETQQNQTFLKQAVRDAVVDQLRKKIEVDIDRLSGNLLTPARSRRVRDVDEALLGVNAVARSRGIELSELKAELAAPLLRIPVKAKPVSVYELHAEQLTLDVQGLCNAAAQDFTGVIGNVLDASTGLCSLASAPLGLSGVVLPVTAASNPEGRRTHARVLLPTPLNWRQANDQISRYEDSLLATFSKIERLDLPMLPGYVQTADADKTLKQSFRYYTRALDAGDAPSELALIAREIKTGDGGPGRSEFAIELWVFTRRSGAVWHEVDIIQ